MYNISDETRGQGDMGGAGYRACGNFVSRGNVGPYSDTPEATEQGKMLAVILMKLCEAVTPTLNIGRA